MAEVQFTKEQQQAIETRKAEVLVAAAAGSGKTAVLIERIVTLIIEDEVSITSIVVLTFTNAAASQMKERLRLRLQALLGSNAITDETKKRIREQLLYLPLAYISTFHAFCIRMLKNYYQYVDLEPTFKIGEENEMALLKEEAMDEVLESFFESGASEFLQTANTFVTTTRIQSFRTIIQNIFEKSRAFAHPVAWREDALQWYDDPEKLAILEETYTTFVKNEITSFSMMLSEVAMQMLAFPKHQLHIEALQEMLVSYLALFTVNPWEGIEQFSLFTGMKWPAISKDNKSAITEVAHKRFTKIRGDIQKLQKNLYQKTEIIEKQLLNKPVVEMILTVVGAFETAFSTKKRQRNVVDFSDVEHFMIKLLEQYPDIRGDISRQITEMLVDEYQDTNETQDTILYYLKNEANRIFMVGDVKQSIYRFRLADPTIFLAKEATFSGLNQEVIYLNQNFRSRNEVITTANLICTALFKLDITYNEDNMLYFGNKQYEASPDLKTHWHFFQEDEAIPYDIVSKEAYKAKHILSTINELLTTGSLYDLKLQENRPIVPSDIAILYRNRTGAVTEELTRLFEEQGIPYSSASDKGYFDAIEVLNMLSLCNVLDNPYNTIDLLSYMRSPLSIFTDNDLVLIKQAVCNKDEVSTDFYQYIQNILATDEVSTVKTKLEEMEQTLQLYRNKIAVLPLSKVLQFIYSQTRYLEFVATLPNGQVRVANLKMLIDLAKKREAYGFINLRLFNRYIKKLQSTKRDFAIAKDSSFATDSIQMMTIHGSKGLEFPIVFLIDMDKQFNKADSRALFQMTKAEGLAFRYTDVTSRTRERTWHYDLIASKQRFDDAAEELRILYVALTRAEQQLHLFLDEDIESTTFTYTATDIVGLTSFGAGLRYAFAQIQTGELQQQLGALQWQINYLPLNETIDMKIEVTPLIADKELASETVLLSSEQAATIDAHVRYRYNKIGLQDAPQKQTVSEIKRREENWNREQTGTSFIPTELPTAIPKLEQPFFIKKQETLTALELGTLYHFVLQHYDYQLMLDIPEYLQLLIDKKMISIEELAQIKPDKITKICHDIKINYLDEGYQIIDRELAFSMTQPARTVYPENELFTTEQVAIQGKIDMLLKKEQTYLLIDYKTDRVTGANQEQILAARYAKQLELYTAAIKRYYATDVVKTKIYAIMS